MSALNTYFSKTIADQKLDLGPCCRILELVYVLPTNLSRTHQHAFNYTLRLSDLLSENSGLIWFTAALIVPNESVCIRIPISSSLSNNSPYNIWATKGLLGLTLS